MGLLFQSFMFLFFLVLSPFNIISCFVFKFLFSFLFAFPEFCFSLFPLVFFFCFGKGGEVVGW